MLDIWTSLNQDDITKILEFHAESSGERIDPSHVTAYRPNICPYQLYEIIRLETRPHLVVRLPNNTVVSSPSLSYVLIKKGETQTIV
jgi:hypothetical protein